MNLAKPDFWKNNKRYYDLKSYWRNLFGCTVHKLQIDASLIYGLGENYTGTLTSSDLNYNTPYNLSMYEGLPPTPIAKKPSI